MRKTAYLLLTCCASYLSNLPALHAQIPLIDKDALGYYEDAFRYSRLTSIAGSSRIQALGGAQTAIGGDISNITGNPAGLGFFDKTTISIGLGAGNAGTTTNYFTQKSNINAALTSGKSLGNLNHLAAVVSLKNDNATEGNAWKGGSFAFSVSRNNNFQDQFAYQGNNSQNSKLDSYVDKAWNIPESQFQNTTDFKAGSVNYLRPAYYAFLLGVPDPPLQGVPYYSYFRDGQERMIAKVSQQETFETKGGQNQWTFGYGGNVGDKFYFGLSAGMTTLNYRQHKVYKEDIDATNSYLQNFTEFDSLKVKGTGINATLGFIVRPINIVRIGVSFTAPTAFSMQETFGTTFESLSSAPNGGLAKKRKESAGAGSYTYRVRTPAHINGGVAVFIGKYGFVTADVEYVAYTTMNVRDYDNPSVFLADNRTIQNIYKNVLNYKGGAEFRYGHFYLRGGYAYQPNPVKEVDFINRSLTHITGGLGYSFKGESSTSYSFDFSLMNTRYQSGYSPYSMNLTSGYKQRLNGLAVNYGDSPYSETKHSLWQGTVTFSVKL